MIEVMIVSYLIILFLCLCFNHVTPVIVLKLHMCLYYMYTLYKMMTRLNLIAVMIAAVLAIGVVGVAMTEEAYAKAPPNAKVRAIQNGNVLGTDPGEEGTIGQDIDCVGGVGTADANDFHCFLVPDNIGIGNINWADTNTINNPPAGVKVLSTTTPMSCAGLPGGLHTETTCFKVTFPASDFTPGHWHFIGVFTKDGNIINLAGNNYRVNSFMVVPELIIGSIGLVGSTLGTLYIYKSKSKKSE
jgi:hypothetical protein